MSRNQLYSCSKEIGGEIDGTIQAVTGDLPDRLMRSTATSSRVLHRRIVHISSREHADLLRASIERCWSTFGGQFTIFVYNVSTKHGHIIHDCAQRRGDGCRCAFQKTTHYQEMQRGRLGKRTAKGSPFLDGLGIADWKNIIAYYLFQQGSSGGNECKAHVYIKRSPSEEYDCQDNSLRWQAIQRKLPERVAALAVQAERDPLHVLGTGQSVAKRHRGFLQSSISTDDASSSGSNTRKDEYSPFAKKVQLVETFLECYITVPIEKALTMSHLPNWNIEFANPRGKNDWQAALDLYRRKINQKSLRDFYNQYITSGAALYRANSKETLFQYYSTPETSLKYLNDLLQFQFNGNDDAINMFLKSIVCWFNKEGIILYNKDCTEPNLKCQTYICIGPPNCGKTWFWSIVVDIALNMGQMGRVHNKNNRFSLMDIVNRRIIIGNEINADANAREDFLKIFEGQDCNIPVKFQQDSNFSRTPIIITTNDQSFEPARDVAFVGKRTDVLYWKSLKYVRHDLKPCYPPVFFDLLLERNIDF